MTHNINSTINSSYLGYDYNIEFFESGNKRPTGCFVNITRNDRKIILFFSIYLE